MRGEIAKHVLAHLKAHEHASLFDIAEAGRMEPESVRKTLFRMGKKGIVRNVGQFGRREWELVEGKGLGEGAAVAGIAQDALAQFKRIADALEEIARNTKPEE